jgi:hypothetical protein
MSSEVNPTINPDLMLREEFDERLSVQPCTLEI